MAGNRQAIQSRIRSVKSTKKITKAMQMIANAKLAKSRKKMESNRFYAGELQKLVTEILHSEEPFESRFLREHTSGRAYTIACAAATTPTSSSSRSRTSARRTRS